MPCQSTLGEPICMRCGEIDVLYMRSKEREIRREMQLLIIYLGETRLFALT